jgi:hypothetical protein
MLLDDQKCWGSRNRPSSSAQQKYSLGKKWEMKQQLSINEAAYVWNPTGPVLDTTFLLDPIWRWKDAQWLARMKEKPH